MTDWSPPDPSTSADPSIDSVTTRKTSTSFFLFWQNNLKFIGIFVAVIGCIDLYRLLELQDERRTSLAANSRALEIINASSGAVGFAFALTAIWLLHMRRHLKHGIIKRFQFNWKRGIVGILLFGVQALYWAQDIEQLSQMRQGVPASTDQIRKMKRSSNGYLWIVLLTILIHVMSNLDYAKLGIDYVTVGPAGIDDPLRYALKYVDPSVITTNLDKYSEFIWPACLGVGLLSVFFGIVTWRFLAKVTKQIKNAHGEES